VLMARPENQVCSDCPERKPTWASLIAPPPGSHPGTEKIGSFCCLECSGSHRRLGVHICFVRSVNLDSCKFFIFKYSSRLCRWILLIIFFALFLLLPKGKEWEVRAMEVGGNRKVNSIFEAHLARTGVVKPTNLARGPERERFIRDKYERRKFYDAAGYFQDIGPQDDVGASNRQAPSSKAPSSYGEPSEAARRRVATRQAHMRPTQSTVEAVVRPQVAKAPASAPIMLDLLDFGFTETAAPAAPAQIHDPFATPLSAAAPTPSPDFNDPFAAPPAQPAAQQQQMPQQQQMQQQQAPATSTTYEQQFQGFTQAATNPAAAPVETPKASADQIMALFNTPAQQTGFGMQNMTGMMPNNNMMGMTNNGNGNNNGGMPQGNMNPMQMQQLKMQQMMAANPQMMAMNNNGGGMPQGNMNPMMMGMMNNGGMQQQQQQQQAMMQQQQMMMGMMNNNNGHNNNAANNNNNNNNNGMYNNMMQGMQQVSMGGGQQQPAQQSGSSSDLGFGFPSSPMGGGGTAPSGGNAQTQQKDDPFSSFGGINAFR
jgi:stromal membrane-associated protein